MHEVRQASQRRLVEELERDDVGVPLVEAGQVLDEFQPDPAARGIRVLRYASRANRTCYVGAWVRSCVKIEADHGSKTASASMAALCEL